MDAEHPAAALACAITIAIFTPYLVQVWRGDVSPRPASWAVWSISTILVGGGQLLAGAGVGAIPILLSGGLSAAVVVCAIRLARRTPGAAVASMGDRWCLGIACGCLPLWVATGDPWWSVVILTIIDLIGFVPTIRTIWRDPRSESILLFTAFAIRNGTVIVALEARNPTTVVFPAIMGATCLAICIQIGVCRWLARRPRSHLITDGGPSS